MNRSNLTFQKIRFCLATRERACMIAGFNPVNVGMYKMLKIWNVCILFKSTNNWLIYKTSNLTDMLEELKEHAEDVLTFNIEDATNAQIVVDDTNEQFVDANINLEKYFGKSN